MSEREKVGTEMRSVQVPILNDEQIDMVKEIGSLQRQWISATQAYKAYVSETKGVIASLEAKIARMIAEISVGTRAIETEVDLIRDYTEGILEFVSVLDGTVVASRPLTPSEKQMRLKMDVSPVSPAQQGEEIDSYVDATVRRSILRVDTDMDGQLREDAMERLAYMQVHGATNKDILLFLGTWWGSFEGGGKSPDGSLYSFIGGNDPRFWYRHVGESMEPKFKGAKLAEKVRSLFNIPVLPSKKSKAKKEDLPA